jgi:hypothetical protein
MNAQILTLYIDPGTGSMLFSVFIGAAMTIIFLLRAAIIKLQFIITGGRSKKISMNKIPYVIYTDSKRYWNVFKPICDEFERREIPLTYLTQSQDDPIFSANYKYVTGKFIGTGNKGFTKLNFINSCITLSSTPSLDVLQWKRSKETDFYVHIPHTVDDKVGYKMFGLDYYDAVLLTGDYQAEDIRYLEKLRGIKEKELVTVGSTCMDYALEHLSQLPKYKGPNFDNITVLLAPSWGESAILSRFGSKIIHALADTGFKIIVRPHPQSKTSESKMLESLQSKFNDVPNLSWNYDNDNLAVLNSADILITDFSGVVYDYTFLCDRPIIYADTKFDPRPYDAGCIPHKLWRFKTLEKLGVKLREEDFANIKQVILNAINSPELKQGRESAKAQAWMFQGESAKRAVDYLVQKRKEIEEKRTQGKQQA